MLFFSQGNWPVCIFFYFLLCHHKKTNNNNIPEHITWQKYLKQTNTIFFLCYGTLLILSKQCSLPLEFQLK